MFTILATQGRARAGRFCTIHGDIETPVFMNVGTSAAIKGAVSTTDLYDVKCQVELSNTYHLHIRPGEDVIRQAGGLQRFMNWDRPILTDSGGFQVFSLAKLAKIRDEGVYFQSHIDGKRLFMGPCESMEIQHSLGSTITMAFDQCINSRENEAEVKEAVDRTYRWLLRCVEHQKKIKTEQLLFGIVQGGTFPHLRKYSMDAMRELDLPGYAIGGLAVGETNQEMYETIDALEPYMPQEKPRYLMGVGTPANILTAVSMGVDFFDCVMPSRNARHGSLFTSDGILNLNNNKFRDDFRPIQRDCGCPACRDYSRAYIRHLLKAKEMLGMRLCVLHNLYFYNKLMEDIRHHIKQGSYDCFMREALPKIESRV